jgi:hypothetical protein
MTLSRECLEEQLEKAHATIQAYRDNKAFSYIAMIEEMEVEITLLRAALSTCGIDPDEIISEIQE